MRGREILASEMYVGFCFLLHALIRFNELYLCCEDYYKRRVCLKLKVKTDSSCYAFIRSQKRMRNLQYLRVRPGLARRQGPKKMHEWQRCHIIDDLTIMTHQRNWWFHSDNTDSSIPLMHFDPSYLETLIMIQITLKEHALKMFLMLVFCLVWDYSNSKLND